MPHCMSSNEHEPCGNLSDHLSCKHVSPPIYPPRYDAVGPNNHTSFEKNPL